MKKKVLAMILSSVMALSLFGCGNGNTQPAAEDAAAEETTENTEAEAETEEPAAEDAGGDRRHRRGGSRHRSSY